ncbi:N-acetyltransferase family protein [Nonomuraea sp. NPDC004702]
MRSTPQPRPRWAARYAGETSTHRLLLADGAGGELVGFAYVSASELYAIHADPGPHGKGIGTVLMIACRTALRPLGHDRAELWVLEGNEPSRSFKDRDGWISTGEARQAEVYGANTRQLRFVRHL